MRTSSPLCPPHWWRIIETEDNEYIGTCRRCGESRTFAPFAEYRSAFASNKTIEAVRRREREFIDTADAERRTKQLDSSKAKS